MGDFNYVELMDALPSFYQHVSSPHGETTLWTVCAALFALPHPPIVVSATTSTSCWCKTYQLPLRWIRPMTSQSVTLWSSDGTPVLQDCLHCSDWQLSKRQLVVSSRRTWRNAPPPHEEAFRMRGGTSSRSQEQDQLL